MRHLGIVTSSFPRDARDPAGRFVLTRVQQLRRLQALEAHVVSIGVRAETRAVADGISLTRVASHGLFDGEGAPEVWERSQGLALHRVRWEAAHVTAELVNAVRAAAPRWHAVESHWLVPSALSVALAAPGLFHTAYAHSGDVAWLEKAPGGAALARWLIARTNEVVCVSSALRDRLRNLVGAWPRAVALRVAAMTEDADVFAPGAGSSREHVVLGVGRLVPIKGFDLLLLAVGGLPRAARPRVVVLGEGPERGRLAGLGVRLGLDLSMPGTVPAHEVAAWLARAAVCVLPSRVLPGGRSEGAPLIVREALAMNTPVIATYSTSRPELPRVRWVRANDAAALRVELSNMLRSCCS